MTRKVACLRPAGVMLAAGFFLPLLLLQAPTRPAFQDPLDTPAASATEVEPGATPSPSISPTILPSDTESPTAEFTETSTETPSESPTATATYTPSHTSTPTPPPPPGPEPLPDLTILINEVGWAGTAASSNDEWIELLNPGPEPVDLAGWMLTDGGDVNVHLRGSLPAYSYLLLERTDDTTISNQAADQIYTGSLNNSGGTLELLGPGGEVIDRANGDGGAWPAGNASTHASMERLDGPDGPGAWRTFTGCWSTGVDAAGVAVNGTPRSPNSVACATATVAPSPTPTPTLTPTSGPSPSPTPSAPTPAAPQSVLINEVAWGGTLAASSDEWIELFNPSASTIDLRGWQLTDDGDIHIALSGSLPPYGFLLLERTSDATIADLAADLIFTGGLNNDGESLRLLDPSGTVIDSANGDGGGWPAGNGAARTSMERRGGDDRSGNWGTFPGFGGAGHDAAGHPIGGTPRQPNAVNIPAPTPTSIPSRVVINEALIRPHYDWEGTGGVTSGDEFIELYNAGGLPVRLLGWTLDDVEGAGSKPYKLPDTVLPAHGFLSFFRSRTHLALNDTGDTVRLLDPDGRLIDEISYLKVRAANLSYGRLPDGGHHLVYGLWPTAGKPNELFVAPRLPLPVVDTFACPAGHLHPLMVLYPGSPLARRHLDAPLLICP